MTKNIGATLANRYKQKGMGYPVFFFSSTPGWKESFKTACYGTYCRVEPALLPLRQLFFNFTSAELFHQFIIGRGRER